MDLFSTINLRLYSYLSQKKLIKAGLAFVCLGILWLAGQAVAAPPLEEPPPGLFSDAGVEQTGDRQGGGRSRLVKIDLAQFGGAGADGSRRGLATPSPTLRLNLFEDVVLTATLERLDPNPSGGFIWIGRIPEIELSHVLFLVKDGLVVGDIRMPRAAYGITPAGEELHQIQQETGPAGGKRPDDVIHRRQGAQTIPPQPFSMGLRGRDDGSIIDLMVVYTPLAQQRAGGRAAIEARIDAGVAQLNAALQNGGITPRVRLVQKLEINYTESGYIEEDFFRLAYGGDGYMEDIPALRYLAKADLVSLIVGRIDPYDPIGLAGMPDEFEPTGGAGGAYSAIYLDFITQEMVLAHEVGHNLGADHDWYANFNETLGYDKGYVNVGGRWTTVMAYPDLCFDTVGEWCPHIAYFSNPNVTYHGAPTGVPVGTSQVCEAGNINNPPCDADNRRSINEWAEFVANYQFVPDPARLGVTINSDPSPVLTSTVYPFFSMQISNVGDLPATVSTIQVTMPADITYEAGSAFPSASYSNGTLLWSDDFNLPGHSDSEFYYFQGIMSPGSLQEGEVLVGTVQIQCSNCPNELPPIRWVTIVNPKQTYLPMIPRR